MTEELTQLKEAIRQKRELVKFMESDLQGVRQSLEESLARYITFLEESCKPKN